MKRTYIIPTTELHHFNGSEAILTGSLDSLMSNPDSTITPEDGEYNDEFTSKGNFSLWDDDEEDIDY